MGEPTLYRYYLPSTPPLGGWGEIVLSSGGFFAAVTDFGNYAFAWRNWGEGDFRDWFADLEKSTDYLLGKIAKEQYDPQATERHIKQCIIQRRRDDDLSRNEARDEWEFVSGLGDGETTFDEWGRTTRHFQDDWYEFRCNEFPGDAQAFAERMMPRLAAVIRAELAKEASHG
jgi:hypothetical protein